MKDMLKMTNKECEKLAMKLAFEAAEAHAEYKKSPFSFADYLEQIKGYKIALGCYHKD